MNLIEICNDVSGVSLNLLLLFLIVKCSKPHLGNYKNLLKIFACNDIFMSIAHAIVEPVYLSSGSALAVYSTTFPNNKYIISVACGWFTVPFTLMNINFLHRFWSVRSPHKILSFSKFSFALKVAPYPIIMAIQWGLAAYSVCDNAFGKEILRQSIPENSQIIVGDGWLILHYWENDKINLSALAVLINDSTIMTVNFAIAGILCYVTLRHIRAEMTFSVSYKTFQFKILRALFAQSVIPVLCVYFPFGLGVSAPLLFPSQTSATFGPWFTFISSFPAMDALVIIWLMRDYRDGLLSIILGKHWKAENSMSIHRTTQVNPL